MKLSQKLFKKYKINIKTILEAKDPTPTDYYYGAELGPQIDDYNKNNPVRLPGSSYQEPEQMDIARALSLAGDEGAHPKHLKQLASHSDFKVRDLVAKNANTDPATMLHLASDPAHVNSILQNPAFSLLAKLGVFDNLKTSLKPALDTIVTHGNDEDMISFLKNRYHYKQDFINKKDKETEVSEPEVKSNVFNLADFRKKK